MFKMNQFKSSFLFEGILSTIYIWNILKIENAFFTSIGILLLYLSLKMLYYIFFKKLGKKYLIVIIIFILSTTIYYHLPLNYFLVLNVLQFNTLFVFGLIAMMFSIFSREHYTSYFVISDLITLVLYPYLLQVENQYFSQENALKDLKQELVELEKKKQLMDSYEKTLMYTSRLEERQKVAQSLHDTLGHVLSGSTMQLEASLLLHESDEEKAVQMIEQTIQNLRDGTNAIRVILKDIQPDYAHVNMEQIKTLMKDVEKQSGVKMILNYDHFVNELTHYQWHLVYANIQEALTNMMKYAKASQCEVSFERLKDKMKISILDNGIGQSLIKKNMGLKGMSSRMAELHGQLIVDGSYGFSVIMLLPIQKEKS